MVLLCIYNLLIHTHCALFIVHVGLSKFLETLDNRAKATVKQTKKHVCEELFVLLLNPLLQVTLQVGLYQRSGLKVISKTYCIAIFLCKVFCALEGKNFGEFFSILFNVLINV